MMELLDQLEAESPEDASMAPKASDTLSCMARNPGSPQRVLPAWHAIGNALPARDPHPMTWH